MSPQNPRTFVLLPSPLPTNAASALATKLLGRIVENPQHPTGGYRPEDPRPILASLASPGTAGSSEPHTGVVQVTECDASLYQSSIKDAKASAQLGKVLGFDSLTDEKSEWKLTGKLVTTRLLPQHRDVFTAVLARHGREVEQLLKDNGGVGYMVVGVKTVLDADVQRQQSKTRAAEGHAALPLAAALAAATQGAAVGLALGPEALDIDPAVSGGRTVGAEWVAKNTWEGEMVFALQYRIVVLKRKGLFWSQSQTAKLKALHVVDFRDGVYGDSESKDSKEVVYEDDEDSDDEMDELEGWQPELSEETVARSGLVFLDD